MDSPPVLSVLGEDASEVTVVSDSAQRKRYFLELSTYYGSISLWARLKQIKDAYEDLRMISA